MATLADIRKVALSLPGAVELNDHGGNWFNVGTKTFVVYGFPSARWIFKLPKPRQELLFEANPAVFQPYRAGAMRWAYVDIAALTPAEIASLVTDAWTEVVSRKVAKAHLGPIPAPCDSPANLLSCPGQTPRYGTEGAGQIRVETR